MKTAWLRLVASAAGTEILYLWLARAAATPPAETWGARWHAPTLFEQTVPFLAIWLGLLLFYLVGLKAVGRVSRPSLTVFILCTSAVFRASLVPVSTLAHPYTSEASDGEQAALQWIGRAGRTVADKDPLLTVRMVAAVADLGAVAMLPGLLKAAHLPSSLALVYGWNPLAVKESSGSGRLEPIGILLLAVGLSARRRSGGLAATGAGLSFLLIPSAVACFPILARALGTAVAPALLPVALVGVTQGTIPQVSFWNPPPEAWGGSLFPVVAGLSRLFLTRTPAFPVVVCLSGWLCFTIYRAWRRDGDAVPRECLWAMGGLLLVSPEVFPWAFLPVAYFCGFSTNRGWYVFPMTAPLTYLAFGSEWSFWLGFAQYFLPYFFLVFDALGPSPDARS